jgi:D-alanyl-lipoteichoic acid acyltransferase DltB (MBOAT superfamily)
LLLAWVLGRRLRWVALLIMSIVFYAALGVPYLLGVLLLVTGVSFGVGLAIEHAHAPARRRALLWLGVATVVAPLAVLKYSGFVVQNLNFLWGLLGTASLPARAPVFVSVGVSFYVFQAISYLIDVYLEIIPAERHFGRFAVFMALFAKIVQGPIERGENLLPQLQDSPALSLADLASGMRLFAWGLFKKVVVADRLAVFVDAVYGDVDQFRGLPLLIGTYFFAAQLYFDFAGYTDMARGIARLFGIRLTENFNAPYFATSIADFWRRWHMSFSNWILDYIFKPLQMEWRDRRRWGTPAALMVTFLVSGIWHGATWCFVAWGVLHGLYMASSVLYKPWQRQLHDRFKARKSAWLRRWQVFVTFHLVCVAWVFFRANSVGQAFHIVARTVAGLPTSVVSLLRVEDVSKTLFLRKPPGEMAFAVGLIALVALGGAYQRRTGVPAEHDRVGRALTPLRAPWARAVIIAVMVYLFAFHGADAKSFVYAQF